MNRFRAVYAKEMAAIFYAPIAYIIIAVFALLMGYTFCAQLFHTRSASLIAMVYQAATLLLLTIPLVTMRQVAEERSSGTLELLLSSPTGEFTLVAGKFCASLTLVAVLLAVMLCYPLTLAWFAAPDWGTVLSGGIGLFLLGAALIAIGIAVSALTSNQVIAAAVTLGVFLMLWMAEVLGIYLPGSLADYAIAMSLDTRLTPFATGVVYLSDVGFFLSLTALGCWVATLRLSRR
ncbi:MAG: ABC transporter permease [Gammaproteobacteria bacterium]|jgi:ABC-2 type transport system permease protein